MRPRHLLSIGIALTTFACGSESNPTEAPIDDLLNAKTPRPVTYTLVDLGTLGGNRAVANDINVRGHVVGTSRIATGQQRAFIWKDGVMTSLGTLGGAVSAANAINAAGKVVGSATTTGGQTHAFVWHRGVMTDLGTLGGTFSEATDINAAGEIVGNSTTAGGNTHAFIWRNGVMTDLGTLGGTTSRATGINGTGHVVGSSTGPGSVNHAFIWKNGTMTDIGDGPTWSWASAIHGATIVGWVEATDPGNVGEFDVALWRRQTRVDLGAAIDSFCGRLVCQGTDVNAAGTIVGYATTIDLEGLKTLPFVRNRSGVVTSLPTLGLTNQDHQSEALGINTLGDIVGYSDVGEVPNDGETPATKHAVLWRRN